MDKVILTGGRDIPRSQAKHLKSALRQIDLKKK